MTEKIQVYEIEGLDCPDCARKVADGVKKLPGVVLSELNFSTGKLTVVGEAAPETVQNRVRALGHEPRLPEDGPRLRKDREKNFLRFMWGRLETRLALLGAVFVLPGLVLNELLQMEFAWVNILAIGAVLSAGFPVARSAWRNLRYNRAIDINFLMTIQAAGGMVIGAYV